MYIIKEAIQEETLLIRDPIYNYIELPISIKPLVDHPLVQRLRWISQLPLEQMVYPSAQHSRFEHSLGVMYLAMQAAITLLNDEISYRILRQAKEEDSITRGISEEEFKRTFIISAGIIGLLHDVGHGPFSHTLEDIYFFFQNDFVERHRFNHEVLSFVAAKNILDDDRNLNKHIKEICLQVLNKAKSLDDLKNNNPICAILRNLIDGVIDVDKGDYLLRDSYHCGVIYGLYDKDRLWRHIRLSDDYEIGVSPKGALEAYTLRFARYKMYKNVYKHHVRNITDALLITTLSKYIEKNGTPAIREINPFIGINSSDTLSLDQVNKLYHWTDDEIIKVLDRAEDDEIKGYIDRFKRRKLPKRFIMQKTNISKATRKHILEFREFLYGLEKICGTNLLFMWVNTPAFPSTDRETLKIKVIDYDSYKSLAQYLGITKEKEITDDIIIPNILEIQVYCDENNTCSERKKEIEEGIVNIFTA